MKKLYLVDVSSMFFRAFFAIPPLTNGKGMPTNALYGFLSMALKLLREVKPDYMAFCFDRKEPSFRLELDPNYKANRSEMPEGLVPQVPFVRKITEELGIHALDLKGYEADDIIGSLTQYGLKQGLEVVIVSGDKDFAQLVNDRVTLYDTMKEIKYNREGVMNKWGIWPEQMIDYLSIVGDSSDNIPGVAGIGPKGAQKLLHEYKTLEGIYENIDSIKSESTRKKLTESKDNAFLAKKLVTIVNDLDMVENLDQLRLQPVQAERFRELLLDLGFKSFEKSIFGNGGLNLGDSKPTTPTESVVPDKKVEAPASLSENWKDCEADVETLKKDLKEGAEVWGLHTPRGFLLGFDGKACWLRGEWSELGQLLKQKKLKWKGFDLKETWKNFSLTDEKVIWDTMLAAYVVRTGAIENFEETLQFFCGRTVPDLASGAQLLELHALLAETLSIKMQAMAVEKIYQDIELPLIPVLAQMEAHGVVLDREELANQSKSLHTDLVQLEKQIHELAGENFNIASPKQLGTILFEKLKLPAGKKTKTGYSTDSDVLEKLKAHHPVAEKILEYRELAKLKSTYVDSLAGLANAETGRVHTSFRQALTTTGRLSSVNPNLQNIPIRTERGRLIRKAFVAPKGCNLISADYSQIELRVIAHITEDEGLMRAFSEDLDIHTVTASEVFGVSLDEVTSDLRRKAKAVNFGIAYGQGVFGLSETLGIPRKEAGEIIDRYFERFARVKEYMSSVIQQAHERGYVETIFGRRRYVDELKSSNPNIKKFGERAAINAPIQGSASDLVKMAMIELAHIKDTPLILQVHDELLFECPSDLCEKNIALIKNKMENVYKLKVPLKVNVAAGPNWDEAH